MSEFDLVRIGDKAALNADCTIQTHLFEDRVMKMSTINIGPRATIGAGTLVLYDTVLAEGAPRRPLPPDERRNPPRADPLAGNPRPAGRVRAGKTRHLKW